MSSTFYIYINGIDCKVLDHDDNDIDVVVEHKKLLSKGYSHVNTINAQIVLERILNAKKEDLSNVITEVFK